MIYNQLKLFKQAIASDNMKNVWVWQYIVYLASAPKHGAVNSAVVWVKTLNIEMEIIVHYNDRDNAYFRLNCFERWFVLKLTNGIFENGPSWLSKPLFLVLKTYFGRPFILCIISFYRCSWYHGPNNLFFNLKNWNIRDWWVTQFENKT